MRKFLSTAIDYLGSIATGAVVGATVGTVVPGLGTAAGFVVGAIGGLVGCRVARGMGYSPFGLGGKDNLSSLDSAKEMAGKTATVVGSGLAGAGVGAAIGTIVFPGLGTVAGAIIGGVAGAVTGGLINNLVSFFGWGKSSKEEGVRNPPPANPGRRNTTELGPSIARLQQFAQRDTPMSPVQSTIANNKEYGTEVERRNKRNNASGQETTSNPSEGLSS